MINHAILIQHNEETIQNIVDVIEHLKANHDLKLYYVITGDEPQTIRISAEDPMHYLTLGSLMARMLVAAGN
jgi:hypothetical protein